MTLFDPGPPEKKKVRKKPVSASVIANNPAPVYEVTVGLTRWYLRAYDDADARTAYRVRYNKSRVHIEDEEIRVRRLLHEDLVELVRVDPRVAARIKKL